MAADCPKFATLFLGDPFLIQYSFLFNDFKNGLLSNVKLFAEDTSLFSVQNIDISARKKEDLIKNNHQACHFKKHFNSGSNKQMQKCSPLQ